MNLNPFPEGFDEAREQRARISASWDHHPAHFSFYRRTPDRDRYTPFAETPLERAAGAIVRSLPWLHLCLWAGLLLAAFFAPWGAR